MSTALLLDTCVLPQKGSIHSNPILSALLRVAAIRKHPIYLTDVSLTEALNRRRVRAEQAVTQLQAAVREVSVVFGNHGVEYYVPSPDDAVDYWRDELAAAFTILESDGRDALEALHREASRRPPARATADGSATGGRDSAIWLAVKRLHLENPDQVTIFVSSNTRDFAVSRSNVTLREELAEELGSRIDGFTYAASPERAVELLAAAADPQEVNFTELQVLVADLNIEVYLLDIAQGAVSERELPQPISLSVNAVRERRAYTVEPVRLSQIDIEFACLSGPPSNDSPAPSEPVPGRASAWLYRGGDEPSFELASLTFADTVAHLH